MFEVLMSSLTVLLGVAERQALFAILDILRDFYYRDTVRSRPWGEKGDSLFDFLVGVVKLDALLGQGVM